MASKPTTRHPRSVRHRRAYRTAPPADAFVQDFAVIELRKQTSWSKTQPEPFHFRTQAGREVDIVLEDRSGRIVGVEVKAGATLRTDDLKGLQELAELAGKRFHRGVVLYMGQETIPFGPRIHALPISALWLEEGIRA